ncbi:GNAT family N-acetyltransferase [Fundicoccus culcitae]|uniref:GNAT family N-acetyltransferase n=1 Tax=Fundicoccus culcitae TaxID=2969821 RepID=A0ABY5P5F8_9LACT|nr:GNAT family N-acetyltransferase [Fundicoccus culcitae]UUX33663.1 GNAT family N-acetyltransferase [Fundicoccus culcitae]
MNIEGFASLSPNQMEAITALERLVHQHDGSYRNIYLENRFNFDPAMPAFWLATENQQLVGFLAIYADTQEDAEFSVIVHPAYRRQKIASQLVAAAKNIVRQYQIKQVIYVAELSFIQQSPSWQEKFRWNPSETELIMQTPQLNIPASRAVSAYKLRQVAQADGPAIARIQRETFGASEDETKRDLAAAFEDESHRLYVFIDEAGQVVGSTSVNLTPDHYYFFGLAVGLDYQNQGVASACIPLLMQELWQEKPLPFRLAVNKDNGAARHVYGKCGFEEITEVVYLSEK